MSPHHSSPQLQALGAVPSSSSNSPSSSSSPSAARERLLSVSHHIMGSSSFTPPSVFTTGVVPKAPEDALFGLAKSFRQDPSDKKVDLVIGAYRDDNAKPWILPVVSKVWMYFPFISFLIASTFSGVVLSFPLSLPLQLTLSRRIT